MISRFFVLPAFFWALLCFGACSPGESQKDGAGGAGNEGGDIGAPCELEEHCASGLICDIHDGRGSCQKAHSH